MIAAQIVHGLLSFVYYASRILRFIFFPLAWLLSNVAPVRNTVARLRKTLKEEADFIFSYLIFKKQTDLYCSDLSKRKSQFFILNRHDMGTFSLLIQYAWLWHRQRERVLLLVLTSHSAAPKICKEVFPYLETLIVMDENLSKAIPKRFYSLFQERALNKIHAYLSSKFLNNIVLYDTPMNWEHPLRSRYHRYLDQNLTKYSQQFSEKFIHAYINLRENFELNFECYHDYIKLNEKSDDYPVSSNITKRLDSLKSNLNITKPYIVLNINAKDYDREQLQWRKISEVNNYNVLIDAILERGYQVIIQGREEQPVFSSRKGLIDYAHSLGVSLENDLALYAGCDFVISSKSGPESFGTLFNKPTLGLNYVEFFHSIPNKMLRFCFKQVWSKQTGCRLSWQELLQSPVYFHMADVSAEFTKDYYVKDLEAEDLFAAGQEFLELVQGPKEDWQSLTKQQKAYRDVLTPLHLDLYHIPGLPCDSYLKKYGSAEPPSQDVLKTSQKAYAIL